MSCKTHSRQKIQIHSNFFSMWEFTNITNTATDQMAQMICVMQLHRS